jgi:uncharacterized protein
MRVVLTRMLKGLFLAFLLIPAIGGAQDAASGIDPATLAKANSGDAAAEYQVGRDYQQGDIVGRDFVQAEAWFKKASDQGYAQAELALGLLLEKRNSGIAEDDAQAAGLLRKAADQGLAEAQYQLALSYRHGIGMAADNAQAAAWLQKAAQQKSADAMAELADLYAHGQGVGKDEKQAFALATQAATLGSAQGEFQLGMAYETGQSTKKDKGQAMDWYRKAADQGFALAQLGLAQLAGSNHGEAYFWASLAAPRLQGEQADKATYLRDTSADKLNPAEKDAADKRIEQWHPVHTEPKF